MKKDLTIEYINQYIRKKGLASHENGENSLSFKLYDLNWCLYFEQGRLSMNVSFELGEDINIPCMMQAMNKVNEDRYIIKTFMQEFMPEDENGKPIPNTSIQRSIVFSFETLCFTEKAFDKVYEFCVYALTDSIDFHRKHYAQYLEANKTRAKDVRIGFSNQNSDSDKADSTVTENNHRKIGFIQLKQSSYESS